jgi:hypothetical protein
MVQTGWMIGRGEGNEEFIGLGICRERDGDQGLSGLYKG